MIIQDRLQQLQQWAKTGVSLTELPSVENYGSKESELALLQYCYYKLIDHLAGNIIEKPNFDVHESVDLFLSFPFGNCVSKEIVVSLCELLVTSDLRPYCKGQLFIPNWTVDDVAGTIYSQKGGTAALLEAVIKDSQSWKSICTNKGIINPTINKSSYTLKFMANQCAELSRKMKKVLSKSKPKEYDSVGNICDNDIYFEADKEVLAKHRKKTKKKDNILQLQFPPEPWIGNIKDPKVIILSGNPGFSFDKASGDSNAERIKNLRIKNKFDDFLDITSEQIIGDRNFLTHQVCGGIDDPIIIGETDYWKNQLCGLFKKHKNKRSGDDKDLVNKIAVFEVHPYHSRRLEVFEGNDELPSQQMIVNKILQLIKDRENEVIIIISRAKDYWISKLFNECAFSPFRKMMELNNVFVLSSAQNTKLTSNNITSYDMRRYNLEKSLKAYSSDRNKKKAFERLTNKL